MKQDRDAERISFVFDVDDTLYDRARPFSMAAEDVLGKGKLKNPQEGYRIYSRCSQEMFELHQRGGISLEESRIRRGLMAMKQLGFQITQAEASLFQERYVYHQSEIRMTREMESVLDLCRERNCRIGLLTNGPLEHQKKKIAALGLLKWVSDEMILISGGTGFAKPDPRIFALAEKQMKLGQGKIYMVGDSWESDIKGAADAGWKTIWYRKETGEKKPADYIVYNERELKRLLDELTENRREL